MAIMIYIAEDNPEDRYLLRFMLESKGYAVQEFDNGESMLEALKLNRPDLIISDILMPRLDGYMLLYRLRQDHAFDAIPFIFYTATYLEEPDQTLAFKMGAARYILKPEESSKLLQEIETVLQEQATRPRPNQPGPGLSDLEYYSTYSQRLAVKLEAKLLEVERSNQMLRARSEELRRQNLENDRLLQETQAALHTRDAFLNVAAHELVTPLTILKGWLQVILRNLKKAGHGQPLSPATEEVHLEKALAQSRRMERVIENIVGTTEIAEGKMILNRQSRNLVALLRRVVEQELMSSQQNRLQVSFDLPGDLQVMVDEERLVTAIVNVIDNALKFSLPDGEVNLTAGYEAHRRIVRICIIDHGPGIAPEAREQIFQPYYQGEQNFRSRNYGGLGLGLYVTRAIIEAHQGHLELISRSKEEEADDTGSTFVIYLPTID